LVALRAMKLLAEATRRSGLYWVPLAAHYWAARLTGAVIVAADDLQQK